MILILSRIIRVYIQLVYAIYALYNQDLLIHKLSYSFWWSSKYSFHKFSKPRDLLLNTWSCPFGESPSAKKSILLLPSRNFRLRLGLISRMLATVLYGKLPCVKKIEPAYLFIYLFRQFSVQDHGRTILECRYKPRYLTFNKVNG